MAEPRGRWPLPHVLFPDEEDDICFGQTSDPSFYTGPLIEALTTKLKAGTAWEPLCLPIPAPRWLDVADQRTQQSTSTNLQEGFGSSETKHSSWTAGGSRHDFGASEDAYQDYWTSEGSTRQCAPCWLDGADQRSQQSTSTNVNEGLWNSENNQNFLTFEGSQRNFGGSVDWYQDDLSSEGSTQQLGLTMQESGSSLNRRRKPGPKKTCKGQRTRYRKLVMRLFEQVRENPRAVDISEMLATVPPSVASNEWLKNKLTLRLVQEQARAMHLPSDA
eukprot:CAMPEP_0172809012 /NCGR_PEP_ID=MMETSP1075-20121228/8007_1 /TAXON_ID=2916 /ORGANISM="Ceratium fusus, Strain PA161109" /LENGTH=274 /DNA_ID=CAMNT_0013648207 /DNA_START=26 /DNA_END=850 /DNA_ORIENTATION=+